jgi:hypothetical protein
MHRQAREITKGARTRSGCSRTPLMGPVQQVPHWRGLHRPTSVVDALHPQRIVAFTKRAGRATVLIARTPEPGCSNSCRARSPPTTVVKFGRDRKHPSFSYDKYMIAYDIRAVDAPVAVDGQIRNGFDLIIPRVICFPATCPDLCLQHLYLSQWSSSCILLEVLTYVSDL